LNEIWVIIAIFAGIPDALPLSTHLCEYGFDAQVLHLPGHSNGSIGVLTGSFDLFCGDLLRNWGKPAPGFGIFDPVGFKASIEKLKSLKITTVYPGHGKPFPMELFIKNHR
jgi:hydroxyacylglutathione hydrolase